MRRTLPVLALLAALSLFTGPPAEAQTGVSLSAGTLGPGVEVSHQFWSQVALRAGGTYLPVSGITQTLEDPTVDVDFTVDATLNTVYLLADYFPVGWLHLSGGAMYNALTVDAIGEPQDDYQLESRTFTREQIGSLSASLEFGRKISPYVGFGLGNLAKGGRVGVTMDAGVAFTGPLSVDLSGTGMLEPSGEQDSVVQEALDGITIYPVLSVGLAIRP